MNTEFVPYEPSLALKELGFDEPCQLGWYLPHPEIAIKAGVEPHRWQLIPTHPLLNQVLSPTFSQAFRWFREKHNLKSCIMFRTSMADNEEYYDWLIKGQEVVYRHFKTYEEAELTCLKNLIEIVKQKQ
jgi:hypothetical protein